jgi:hypothetical protein
MVTQFRFIAAVLAFCLWAGGASALPVYDESVSGDLSDNNLAPTAVLVGEGSNVVTGSTSSSPLDRDIFSLTIAAGFELAAIVLDVYNSADDQGFFAVEAGNQITSLFSPASLLGNTLIGALPGATVGNDVLDDLGNALFGGTGFVGALGPGTYAFWIQETSGRVPQYALDFQVRRTVPLPATLLLLLPALLVLMRRN